MQFGVCEQHEITYGDFLRVWILPDAVYSETLILHYILIKNCIKQYPIFNCTMHLFIWFIMNHGTTSERYY